MGNRKRKKGTEWICLGIMMLLAALLLGAFNMHEDFEAGQSTREVIDSLKEELPDAQEDEKVRIPEYLLDPDREMPVKRINGTILVY